MPGRREIVKAARGPEIMADAAHAVLTRGNAVAGNGSRSGNFYTDEQVLRAAGVTDFSAVQPWRA